MNTAGVLKLSKNKVSSNKDDKDINSPEEDVKIDFRD